MACIPSAIADIKPTYKEERNDANCNQENEDAPRGHHSLFSSGQARRAEQGEIHANSFLRISREIPFSAEEACLGIKYSV
jgi:hypothetical protein